MNKTVAKYYNQEILKQACEAYKIPFEHAKLIRANSNLIFDCGDTILRLTLSKIRTQKNLKTEIDWLQFLGKEGLDVVKIIPSKSRKNLTKINCDEHYFTAVCFEKIIGERIGNKDWNDEHFQKLGSLTGKLHRVGKTYKEKPNLKYVHWDEIPEFNAANYLPKDDRALKKLHDKLVQEIKEIPINETNYGIVHYDIHQGNYLLGAAEKKIFLFDFEMICKSWYINDVATVLYYAASFPGIENRSKFEQIFMKNFWEEYEKEHEIAASEKEYIPRLLLYRDLLVYGFLCQIWEGKELNKKEKNYLLRLSNSIKIRRRFV